jgi:predicted AAA+ superfamily ATPase
VKIENFMQRLQINLLKENCIANKIVLLIGPRKVGKRTMVLEALISLQQTPIEFNAGNKKDKALFQQVDAASLNELFGTAKFTIIHEAQYIEKLQEIIEHILSGSIKTTLILCCSFEPAMDEVLREVLQVQGLEMKIMPPTFYELAQHNSLPVEEQLVEQRLVFGNYPAVTEDLANAEATLKEMIQTVIFTNLGVTDRINKGAKLMRMLQTIAFSVGEAISYNEIAEKCDLDNETVERYVDLLVRSFLLIRIPTLYSGHRYELKKSHVIYFADNGIRNAVINNFNPIEIRNDLDGLWRNWLISERIKWNQLNGKNVRYQFWKTHTKQTIDFIETSDEKIHAYKTIWGKKKTIKFPASFQEAYPTIATHTLNRSTYWGFLTKK